MRAEGAVGASGIVRTLIGTADEAQAIATALRTSPYQISYYEVKEVQDRPYPPFACPASHSATNGVAIAVYPASSSSQ